MAANCLPLRHRVEAGARIGSVAKAASIKWDFIDGARRRVRLRADRGSAVRFDINSLRWHKASL